MKVNKLLLKLLFLFSFLYSKGFIYEKEISLKKDQEFRLSIETFNISKNLIFKWTLFKNDGIVILLKYDHFPYQFILYKNYNLNAFKLNLDGLQGSNSSNELKIYFKDITEPYIDSKALASFKFYINGNVSVEE